MATIPAFLPGKFHEQRRLVGYGSWVTKSCTQLSLHTHTHTHTHSLPRGLRIFEGNDFVLFSFLSLATSTEPDTQLVLTKCLLNDRSGWTHSIGRLNSPDCALFGGLDPVISVVGTLGP